MSSIVTTFLILGALTATYLQLYDVLKVVTSNVFASTAGVFQGVLVLILLIAYWIEVKRNKSKQNADVLKEVNFKC